MLVWIRGVENWRKHSLVAPCNITTVVAMVKDFMHAATLTSSNVTAHTM